MPHDLKEIIDNLWNVVEEKMINTEAASMQTANVNHQTNLECRDILLDDQLVTRLCSCSNDAEEVCPPESAESKTINGTHQPNVSAVQENTFQHFSNSSSGTLGSRVNVIQAKLSDDNRNVSRRHRVSDKSAT